MRRRRIDVWDAGCGMGQESYSLAIIFREHLGRDLFRNVRICATDIDDGEFGGALGEYRIEELERVPLELLARYFSPDETTGRFCVVDEIKQAVEFRCHDLLSLEPVREGFGLIVCKNVLSRFTPPQRVAVIEMFHRALAEGGYFVTEQNPALPDETRHLFHQVTGGAQVFQKGKKSWESRANLQGESLVWSPAKVCSNAYVILGDWSRQEQVSAILETGSYPSRLPFDRRVMG